MREMRGEMPSEDSHQELDARGTGRDGGGQETAADQGLLSSPQYLEYCPKSSHSRPRNVPVHLACGSSRIRTVKIRECGRPRRSPPDLSAREPPEVLRIVY